MHTIARLWVRAPPGVSYFPDQIVSIVSRTTRQQSNVGAFARAWLAIRVLTLKKSIHRSLQWRHKERDGVSTHHECLLNCLFRRRSKKTSKLRVTGLCAGNSPVTGEFPAQRASNAGNVSIWWRHGIDSLPLLQYQGTTQNWNIVLHIPFHGFKLNYFMDTGYLNCRIFFFQCCTNLLLTCATYSHRLY